MLYDLAEGPPEPGSLLESLFILVTKRRMEAQYLGVRLLVEATLAPHLKDTKLSEANRMYLNSMFPHLAKDRVDRDKEAKETMKHWVGRGPMSVTAVDSPDQRRQRKRARMTHKKNTQYMTTRPRGRTL
jgi:hypothetical protein